MMARIRTFLVTGASSGLGKAIAARLLAEGQRVVGTFRRAEQIAEFDALAPGRAFGRSLDQTDEDAIEPAITAIEAQVGPIDVLVANAGYGHEGVFEESTMAQLRAQFEVNVFGTVAVIKAVLPGMRERGSGNIFVVTSMGGIVTFPGLSFYHGSKFALEGIVGALAQEVAGFGVHVTAIEPGSFRTDWAGRSMVRTQRSISDYDALLDPIRARRQANSGKQLGNPELVAQAIMRVVESADPPVHLVLGSDALRLIDRTQDALRDDISRWADVSASTDFPEGSSLG
jgi:NAD(P)-dependent dehydrogenase (short-subunit alcohol dehydrogenase family)